MTKTYANSSVFRCCNNNLIIVDITADGQIRAAIWESRRTVAGYGGHDVLLFDTDHTSESSRRSHVGSGRWSRVSAIKLILVSVTSVCLFSIVSAETRRCFSWNELYFSNTRWCRFFKCRFSLIILSNDASDSYVIKATLMFQPGVKHGSSASTDCISWYGQPSITRTGTTFKFSLFMSPGHEFLPFKTSFSIQ